MGEYSNKLSLKLGLKPFRDIVRFAGRSTRTEIGAFYLLGMLASLLLLTIHFFADFDYDQLSSIDRIWSLVWNLPWIALFVRRLHDQGRSSALALMIGVAELATIAASWWTDSPDGSFTVSLFAWHFHPAAGLPAILIGAVSLIVVGALLVFTFLPGEEGPNRYGPDPRLAPMPAT